MDAGLDDIKSRAIQPPTAATGAYLPLLTGQTVCTVKNEKGSPCHGHVKPWHTAPRETIEKAAKGNVLSRCQRCFVIYEGPPQEFLKPGTVK